MNADTHDNTSTVYLRTTVHDQEGMIENVLIVIDEILKHHQSQSIINQFIFFNFRYIYITVSVFKLAVNNIMSYFVFNFQNQVLLITTHISALSV